MRLEISEMPIASISVGNHLGHPISIVYFFPFFWHGPIYDPCNLIYDASNGVMEKC